MIKHFYTNDPVKAFITLDKDDEGGNNCCHTIAFRTETYTEPVVFKIRGEWEFQAFSDLIKRICGGG